VYKPIRNALLVFLFLALAVAGATIVNWYLSKGREPSTPPPLFLQALEHEKKGELAEAEDDWSQLTEQYYKSTSYLQRLGEVLLAQNKLEKASEVFQRILQIDKRNVPAQVGLARIKALRGDIEQARKELFALHDAHKDDPSVVRGLADVHFWNKEFDLALAYYQEYLKAVPEDVAAIEAVGNVHYARKEYSEAAESFRMAQAIAPGRGSLQKNLEAVREARIVEILSEAVNLEKQGRTRDAIELLENARQDFPEEKRIFWKLSQFYEFQKEYEKAIGSYDEILRLDEKHIGARMGRARMRLLLGQEDVEEELEDEINQILAEDPENPDALKAMADLHYRRKNLEQAGEYYEKYIEKAPEDYQALENLGNVRYEQEKYEEAEELYRKALDLSTRKEELEKKIQSSRDRRADKLTAEADRLRKEGKNDEAIAILEKVVLQNPDYAVPYMMLGEIYLEKKNYEKAKMNYQKALSIVKENIDVETAIAQADFMLGNLEPAKERLVSILKKKPDAAGARRMLGVIYYSQKKHADALAQFLKYLEAQPDDYEILHFAGNLYFARRDYANARVYYTRALVQKSDLAEAKEMLASLDKQERSDRFKEAAKLVEQKEYESARAAFAQIVSEEPDNILYRLALADALYRMKALEESLREYGRILEMKPAHRDAGIRYARISIELKDFEAAEKTLLALKEKYPDDSEVLRTLGALYLRQKNSDAALEHLLKYLKLRPDDPDITMSVADIYFAKGRHDEAQEYYKKVIELPGEDDSEAAKRLKALSHAKADALYKEAGTLESEGDTGGAIARMGKAIEIDGDFAGWHIERARMYFSQKHFRDAQKEYEAASALEPENIFAHVQGARMLAFQNKKEEALTELLALLEEYPDNPQVHRALGEVYQMMDKNDPALKHFHTYLETHPDDVDILERVANIYDAKYSVKKAQEYYEKVLEIDPERKSARRRRDQLGSLQYKEIEIGYRPALVNSPGDEVWEEWTLRFTYKMPDNNAIWVTAYIFERFDNTDGQIGVGGIYFFNPDLFFQGEVKIGIETEFAPDFSFEGQISRRLIENLIGHLRYNFLNFDVTDVHIISPALQYYFGKNDIELRGFFTINRIRPGGTSLLVRFTRQWTEKFRSSFGYVTGDRVYDIDTLAELSGGYAWVVFVNGDYQIDERYGIRFSYSHGEENPTFIQDEFGASFYVRW